jgi:hypothetical protein
MCTNLADHLAPPCHKNMPKKRPQLLRFIAAETQKTIGKSGRPILVHPPVADHPAEPAGAAASSVQYPTSNR